MIPWLDRDGKLILYSRIVRSVGLGLVAVLLPIYLSVAGYTGFEVGLLITLALVSSAIFAAFVGPLERILGRKKVLVIFGAAAIVSGVIFILSMDYAAILAACVFGTMNLASSGAGPFQAVEQAILPQTSRQEHRISAFALYNMGGALASSFGALASGMPTVLQARGLGITDSFRLMFLVYALTTVVGVLFYSKLSEKVEQTVVPFHQERALLSSESTRRIARLSALMGLDSFGGGFVIQSMVSLWFYIRFGASLGQLSLIFFGFGLLSSVAYLVSARIAHRLGLLRTMVFTHFPSNILTILIPFAPTLSLATGIYLLRSFLNPMDVVPRQAYTALIVKPNERVAAAGYTNMATGAAQSISPSVAGYFLQSISSLSFPFIIGGGLKAIYDVVLYHNFKALKEEDLEKQSSAVLERLGPEDRPA